MKDFSKVDDMNCQKKSYGFLFGLISGLTLFFPVLLLAAGSHTPRATVELRPYKRVQTLVGFTEPVVSYRLAAEVSGLCTEVLADVGDLVPDSGIIAKLDTTFVKINISKNRIAQEQAGRQLELEQKNLNRYTKLISKKSTAEATFDEASLKADINELTLKNLQIEQQRLEELLSKHTLAAPEGMQILERFIEPGEYIRTGEPIAVVGDFSELVIPFQVTYRDLARIRNHSPIHLYLPDLDREVVGQLFRVSPGYNEKTRKIPVDIKISEENFTNPAEMRGGLRVLLNIVNEESGAFVIDRLALESRYESHWLMRPEGQKIKVTVIGYLDDGQTAIVGGNHLVAGDLFVAKQSVTAKDHTELSPPSSQVIK